MKAQIIDLGLSRRRRSSIVLGPMADNKLAYFFGMSRSCFRTSSSRRGRFSSFHSSGCSSKAISASRSWLNHRVNVERPTPGFSTISRLMRPFVIASRPSSRRNAGAGSFPFDIEHLLISRLVLSKFPRRIQSIVETTPCLGHSCNESKANRAATCNRDRSGHANQSPFCRTQCVSRLSHPTSAIAAKLVTTSATSRNERSKLLDKSRDMPAMDAIIATDKPASERIALEI